MMKWFGPYTGYALQEELEREPTPVGDTCDHCDEEITSEDTGVLMAGIPDRWLIYHWNCFLRGTFGSVAHIEGRCGCPDCGSAPGPLVGDDPALTRRQAADAAVAAWNRKRRRGR